MAKRIITEEAEARQCVKSASLAGQTVTAWAREHGIDGRSVRAWPRKFGLTLASTPALVELVPRPESRRSPSYAIVVNDIRFEFGEEVSAPMIQRIVGALRSC